MLVMDSKMQTVAGVTVFADHADPNQFWYLPEPAMLAQRNGDPQFVLVRYRAAVADSGVAGGGFLTMEIELRLDPDTERQIRTAISRFSDGTPRLTAVPFDEGSVQIAVLNLQGGGGTAAPTPPPGALLAVTSILGSSTPSLTGSCSAVFSLTLSQEGSTILDQAFHQGAIPVGALYNLKYAALQPALDVEITANFKRIYDRLSFGVDLSAGFPVYGIPVYLEAGIDMAFEKLKQEGVIAVKVINFSDAADAANKEQWALDFFKSMLLEQWFKPTLAPVTFDQKPTGGGPAGGGATGGAAGGAAGGASPGGAAGGAAGGASPGGAAGGAAGGASPGGAAGGAAGGASPGGAAGGAAGGASPGGAAGGAAGGASRGCRGWSCRRISGGYRVATGRPRGQFPWPRQGGGRASRSRGVGLPGPGGRRSAAGALGPSSPTGHARLRSSADSAARQRPGHAALSRGRHAPDHPCRWSAAPAQRRPAGHAGTPRWFVVPSAG